MIERRRSVGEKTVDTIQGNVKEHGICMNRGGMTTKSGDDVLFSDGSRRM